MVHKGSDDLDRHLHGSHGQTGTSHLDCRCGRAAPGAHTRFQCAFEVQRPQPHDSENGRVMEKRRHETTTLPALGA